jgi:hypothetical protein
MLVFCGVLNCLSTEPVDGLRDRKNSFKRCGGFASQARHIVG